MIVKSYTHKYGKIFQLTLTATYIESNSIFMAKRYLGKTEPKHQVKVICPWLEHNAIPDIVICVHTWKCVFLCLFLCKVLNTWPLCINTYMLSEDIGVPVHLVFMGYFHCDVSF